MNISTLKDIKNASINVCFIQGNRQVSNKNVKSKTASIDKYGILVPLMYVKGTKAVKDGCSLMTSDGKPIPSEEADKYIVIVDGQHRYSAAIEKSVSDEEIYLFESYAKASTKELLAEANVEVEKWKGEDYIAGATLAKPENELLQFANSLSLRGFPISTISLILCWDKHKFTSKKLSKLMKGETVNIEYDIKNKIGEEPSGGEKAEFNLLKEISNAHKYDVLLIDEPEASFDNPFISENIVDIISSISEKTTVCLTTHNSTLAMMLNPDKIIFTENKNGIHKVYYGTMGDKTFKTVDGEEIISYDSILNVLEAGASVYKEKGRKYESFRNNK